MINRMFLCFVLISVCFSLAPENHRYAVGCTPNTLQDEMGMGEGEKPESSSGCRVLEGHGDVSHILRSVGSYGSRGQSSQRAQSEREDVEINHPAVALRGYGGQTGPLRCNYRTRCGPTQERRRSGRRSYRREVKRSVLV
jgi:hypothetical protein